MKLMRTSDNPVLATRRTKSRAHWGHLSGAILLPLLPHYRQNSKKF